MKVNELIEKLIKLSKEGHGLKHIYVLEDDTTLYIQDVEFEVVNDRVVIKVA